MISHLPLQPTPFIGRAAELRALGKLLNQPEVRLVSLLGLGGVGKTRLALAAAQQYHDTFDQPVYFISLTPNNTGTQTAFAIAQAIGFHLNDDTAITEQLITYLVDKQILLVLDSLEHLLPDVDLISQILGATPDVKFLVTSREKLNLRGEVSFLLKGFTFDSWQTVEEALQADAICLFLESARRIQPQFSVSAYDLPTMQRICQLVKGIPLGIELAAAWVDVMSLQEIGDEIEQNYRFLEAPLRDLPPRHHSLWAVFNSSWDRLSVEERDILSKISVFPSGFSRKALQTITAANLRTVQSLINKSLLTRTDNGRYEIHSLLRQFAATYLTPDQQQAIHQSHTAFYLNWLHDQETGLKGAAQSATLDEIDLDFVNVRLAWLDAGEQRKTAELDAALESLFLFCMMRNRYLEGELLFQQTETQLSQSPNEGSALLCARIKLRRLWIRRWREGTFTRAQEVTAQLRDMLPLFQQHASTRDYAIGLLMLGDAQRMEPSSEITISKYTLESLQSFQALEDNFYTAWAFHFYSRQAMLVSGLAKAIELQQGSLNLRRQSGDQNGVIYALYNLSTDLLLLGDLEQSAARAQEMLDLSLQTDERSGELMAQTTLGLVACLHSDANSAAALNQRILALSTAINHPLGQAYSVIINSFVNLIARNTTEIQGLTTQLDSLAAHGIVRFFRDLLTVMNAYVLGNLDAVQAPLHDALHYALRVHGTGIISWCMQLGAVWSYGKGDTAYAATLLTSSEDYATCRLFADWKPLIDLRTAVDRIDTPHVSDLESLAQGLLRKLGGDGDHESGFPAHILAANQALFEPLSVRELEVLNLIAQGMNNQQIADHLIVEISTIKKHITNIYGKLAVTSRTQAILQAQQLGLVQQM